MRAFAIHSAGGAAFDSVSVVILLSAVVLAVIGLARPETLWRRQMRMTRRQFRNRETPEPSAAVLVFGRVLAVLTLVVVALLVWLAFFR